MAKNWFEVAQQLCLALPDAEEFISHGAPSFRVKKGRVFAMYAANHHGDGRLALWLNSPPGAQAAWVPEPPGDLTDPYFVPPYLGPRGWLGVCVERLPVQALAVRVREAYENTAPIRLHGLIKPIEPISLPPPASALEVDPLLAPAVREIVQRLRGLCLALPETSEGTSYGATVWRAGKKAFVQMGLNGERAEIVFFTGGELQSMLIADPRFRLPAYLGPRGWTALDVSGPCSWQEIQALLLSSYREVAIKRMLLKLPDDVIK